MGASKFSGPLGANKYSKMIYNPEEQHAIPKVQPQSQFFLSYIVFITEKTV